MGEVIEEKNGARGVQFGAVISGAAIVGGAIGERVCDMDLDKLQRV